MSDEKRQTRLLPFRLRRMGAAGRDEPRRFDGADDFEADAELTTLLRAWQPPAPTPEARERLLADFRATAVRPPLWRRALSSEVRVPLPVAACAALALLLSLLALGAHTRTRGAQSVPTEMNEVPVRVVEVPVERERVVTRTVYVEKKGQPVRRGVPARPREREAPAAAPDARRVEPAVQAQADTVREASTGYFTRVDMGDFQPADEVKIRIVRKGSVDEK